MICWPADWPVEVAAGIAHGTAKPEPVNTAPADTHGLSATPVTRFLYYDNYILSRDLPVEGGINRVSIRSTESAGRISLTASAEGLAPAHLTLVSRAVVQRNGLSRFDPAAALPVHLDRGPTPTTPSFHVTRDPIKIVSATAGANEDDAYKAFDDNETTAWTNASARRSDVDTDGLPIRHAALDETPVHASLETAWIEYTLAQPCVPTELDLKLSSFRVRRYPIVVTLDGETIYKGSTPTSLGYITIPLTAKRLGTHLRIQLTGVSGGRWRSQRTGGTQWPSRPGGADREDGAADSQHCGNRGLQAGLRPLAFVACAVQTLLRALIVLKGVNVPGFCAIE